MFNNVIYDFKTPEQEEYETQLAINTLRLMKAYDEMFGKKHFYRHTSNEVLENLSIQGDTFAKYELWSR